MLLMIVAFTVIYILHDTAAAPYDGRGELYPGGEDAAYPPEDLEDPNEPDDEPGTADNEPSDPMDDSLNQEDVFEDPGFVTVSMDSPDISVGYLILVNNEHAYRFPADTDLVNIEDEKTASFRVQGRNYRIRRSVMEPLDDMIGAFVSATGNTAVMIISSFRSYETQQFVLDNYISRVGRAEALKWVSLPGHSEHHTGLAVDFGVYTGGSRATFTGVGSTSWFRRNSYTFGFVLRYPQDKTDITGTSYEPWHFRYVGLPHSYIMVHNNWCLEEYLELLREHTFDEPFEAEYEGVLYRIYFTTETEVPIPYNSMFDISGNNIDGFIVTTYQPDSHDSMIIDVTAS
jgi:D-alanyl-D-alanine carboxypeptidase